jgi:hypothetical protein
MSMMRQFMKLTMKIQLKLKVKYKCWEEIIKEFHYKTLSSFLETAKITQAKRMSFMID